MTNIADYDYALPTELIAQEPLKNRADSRLMVVDRAEGTIEHVHFRDLPSFLRPEDAIVLNNTRVLPAKLVGYRNSTGGRWQGLYIESDERDVWKILCKTRGRLVEGERIGLVNRQGIATCELVLISRLEDGMWAAKVETDRSTIETLDKIGRVPLPHYIRKGENIPADIHAYQCVFAEHAGSIAAPTAGLHFTESLLTQIEQMGVTICRVTLHVGVGTFRPIKSESLDEHRMHSEWCEVTQETVDALASVRQNGGRIISVGTTSVRTLESASRTGELAIWKDRTDLFIRPSHRFNAVDALVTNFHLPRSTLLVLVQTFAGSSLIKNAYEEAIAEEYRFFSYGDAMLIV